MLSILNYLILLIIIIIGNYNIDAYYNQQQQRQHRQQRQSSSSSSSKYSIINSLVLRKFQYPPIIYTSKSLSSSNNNHQNKTLTLSPSTLPPLPPLSTYTHDDHQNGLIILNRLVKESFLQPTWNELWNQRYARKRIFTNLPTYINKIVRGLTNLTMAIGRTINSENGNGSLSRLITNRLVGVSESLMGWVERSVDDLPSIPRLDAQECMKRSICEAHNQPKKYGAVGLIIQLFFPPYLDAEDADKIVSKYQLAARYGRGENANCAAQYDDCMINVLDILQGAINMIF